MSKITLAAAGAVGYVLGSRAGRERYDQISEKAQSLWQNPKVQQGKRRAQQKAEQVADDQGISSGDSSQGSAVDGFSSVEDGSGHDRNEFNV